MQLVVFTSLIKNNNDVKKSWQILNITHNAATSHCSVVSLPSSQVYKWKIHRLDRRNRGVPGQSLLELHLIRLRGCQGACLLGWLGVLWPLLRRTMWTAEVDFSVSLHPQLTLLWGFVVPNHSWNQKEPVCYFQFGCRSSGGKALCISNRQNSAFNSESAVNPYSDLNVWVFVFF